MTRKELIESIGMKESYLCIGLDSDKNKIPKHLLKEKDPVFEFNKQIIDETHQFAVAYKPNVAFYEVNGSKGWESLQKTQEYIEQKGCFSIADAKRGDIGNTSGLYARTFFNKEESGLNFDAVTVAPYMGRDSVEPFLKFEGKWSIVLGLTSNESSKDFQQYGKPHIKPLFERVLCVAKTWGNEDNTMFVVGATQAESLIGIRKIIPNHFLLIPGVGEQGGSLEEVSKYGLTKDGGILVNSSRAIIFASSGEDFAKVARKKAEEVQSEMKKYLKNHTKLFGLSE